MGSAIVMNNNPKFVRRNGIFADIYAETYIARYVSLGDSIAAGHAIDDAWATTYGDGSQYGKNGNTETAIVPDCYTDLIRKDLESIYGGSVDATSFARSGDTVADLMEKLNHEAVKGEIAKATLVTVCIGANDVLEPAMSYLDEYINTGDLSTLAAIVEANLATLNNDDAANSYKALFDKLAAINPKAKCAFTTIYNPYKYLWLEEGHHGFFGSIINTIPTIEIFGLDIDSFIKDSLLGTPAVQQLFSRVNGLCDWAEKYVTMLNDVLRGRLSAYGNANFLLADTKAVYDPVPDRPIAAPKHYNDLVNVEYTRGYDTAAMDWGRLWEGSSASDFWWDLATKYTSVSGIDINGFASELVQLMIEKVIVPDIDPHPENYGHYALERSFADALGWATLPRRTITFDANGGSGSMAAQKVVALDNMTAYTNIKRNAFAPAAIGYYWNGWLDANGAAYTDGQFVGLAGDLTLNAQWSNIYAVKYMHSNHTNLYGNDETGHQECYALYINGELKPKFGTFEAGSSAVYYVPYGATIKVCVSNYNPSEFTYDDADCDVYWNGTAVSSGYRGTEYTFTLQGNVTIDFRWKIAGSLVTLDAQSWEDCYITTG